jgi:hypothetical protein
MAEGQTRKSALATRIQSGLQISCLCVQSITTAAPTTSNLSPNVTYTNHDKVLFFSFFQTLINQEITVELKNDLAIHGVLRHVDQYLNFKLDNITVVNKI